MVQPPEKQFSKKCQLQMCYPIFMASPTASHGIFWNRIHTVEPKPINKDVP